MKKEKTKKPGRPKDRFVKTKKAEPSKPVRIPLSKLKEVDELIKKK